MTAGPLRENTSPTGRRFPGSHPVPVTAVVSNTAAGQLRNGTVHCMDRIRTGFPLAAAGTIRCGCVSHRFISMKR